MARTKREAPSRDYPCPACAERGEPGRIGSHRTACKLCNRWAQGVIRATHSMLRLYEPEVFAALREQAELETYQRVTKEAEDDVEPSA